MTKRIVVPFAENGDRAVVQDSTQANGEVNYNDGYPAAYSQDIATDTNARRVNRDRFNQLHNDITSNQQFHQENGYPPYFTPAENGGSAISYRLGATVMFNGVARISTIPNNTNPPSDNTTWANKLPLPVMFGGTGAENAEDARTNLGISEDEASVFTLLTANTTLVASARYRVRSNVTLTLPSSASDGQEIFVLVNSSSGSFSGSIRTANGSNLSSVDFGVVTPGTARFVWDNSFSRWMIFTTETAATVRTPTFTLLQAAGTSTYTVPDGVSSLVFIAVGGGGSGGDGVTSSPGDTITSSGGGGAGAGISPVINTPAESYSVTVGEGGERLIPRDNGGTTSVSGVISSTGGRGGQGQSSPGVGGESLGTDVMSFTGETGDAGAPSGSPAGSPSGQGGGLNSSFLTGLATFLTEATNNPTFVNNLISNIPVTEGGDSVTTPINGSDGTNGGGGSGGGGSNTLPGGGGDGYIMVVEL